MNRNIIGIFLSRFVRYLFKLSEPEHSVQNRTPFEQNLYSRRNGNKKAKKILTLFALINSTFCNML
jgi:hypothetical protein